jgi:hypothetical protein
MNEITYATPIPGVRIGDLPSAPRGEHITDSDTAADNNLRARFAVVALKAFAERVGSSNEGPEQGITDLLADLHHLADALDLSFEGLLDRADVHYAAEIRGEL